MNLIKLHPLSSTCQLSSACEYEYAEFEGYPEKHLCDRAGVISRAFYFTAYFIRDTI